MRRFLALLSGLAIAAVAALSLGTEQAPAQRDFCPDPASAAVCTPLTGNAAGTTGAVVGTLAATAGKLTYICGFNVSSIGGTATVGPITVAGLVGSSQVYQVPVNSAAGAIVVTQTFKPCIPASAPNTAITVTTTANGTASAVDVNSWGYQL